MPSRRDPDLRPLFAALAVAALLMIGGAAFGVAILMLRPEAPPNPALTPTTSPGAWSAPSKPSTPYPRKNVNRAECTRCDGTGVDRMTWQLPEPHLCPQCGGSGVGGMGVMPPNLGMSCPFCDGSGWESDGPNYVRHCRRCGGTGK